ncbi:MAG: prepilin-type N-terminal cleavage/methylation domain-containing protein [Verrucomicrobia bacterium]|nr:prepilin-type N-terminal cleavage/methylation domain-containing protein [Verrucomicrobiota bacterium]
MPVASHRRRFAPAGCRPCRGARAFTLLELLTAITVIAILATISIGAVRGAKERAQIAHTRAELASLSTALEEFKRLYGDYPQTGEFTQAPVTPSAAATGPGTNTAQAKLFNCFTGVFGARAFANNNRLNGPNLLEIGKFSINGTLTNQFLRPVSNTPNPPSKPEMNACLLDPWGQRYLYYYKNARNPAAWQATGYVLYSAGPKLAPNATQTPPITVTSGLMLAAQTPEMADNIYANP